MQATLATQAPRVVGKVARRGVDNPKGPSRQNSLQPEPLGSAEKENEEEIGFSAAAWDQCV